MTQASNIPVDLPNSRKIRVMGPQKSGKTTLMAALVLWPNSDPTKSPIQEVACHGDAAKSLTIDAQNLLVNGRALASTIHKPTPNDIKYCEILVTIKPKFLDRPGLRLQNRHLRFSVSAKDYAGEFFKDLQNMNSNTADFDSYLQDCSELRCFLILFDARQDTDDTYYTRSIHNFHHAIRSKLGPNSPELSKYRIAVGFTKVEKLQRGAYINDNSREFAEWKFPDMDRELKVWQHNWGCQVEYFYCSAFGWKPNGWANTKVDESEEVIDDPDLWRPFGLVTPLYWLQTGIIYPELEHFD
jgi:hypothetical protein